MSLLERLRAAVSQPPVPSPSPQTLTPPAPRGAAALIQARKAALAALPAPPPPTPAPLKRKPSDVTRIVDLPLKDYLGVDLTDELRKPGAPREWVDHKGTKIKGLRPIQSAALAAIRDANGGFLPIGVGHGKAAIALLAPTVLEAEIAILLTTTATVDQLRRTFAEWRRYYRIIPRIYIISYDTLSTPKGTSLLTQMTKDFRDEQVVMVADEAHKLAYKTSARTDRVLRFFTGDEQAGLAGHPGVRFVALSGTLTNKSLHDFGHLAELALRENSPVPRDETNLNAWAECIDAKGQPSSIDYDKIRPLVTRFAPGESLDATHGEERQAVARRAFQARLRSCPGVVCSDEQSIGASLLIIGLDLDVPEKVTAWIKQAETEGVDPNGDPFVDDIAMWRLERQLSAGFYYQWDWPDGVVDLDWVFARRNWHRHCRAELADRRTEGYDSPQLVSNRLQAELERLNGRAPNDPLLRAWAAWDAQRGKRWKTPDGHMDSKPPTKTVWVDPFFVDAVAERIQSHRGPIIAWYESEAVREALRARGVTVYGPGEVPPMKPGKMALSTRTHKEGLDGLQKFCAANLVIEPPSSGAPWEQFLGRTHRSGQEADEVQVWVYTHTKAYRNAIAEARRKARYIEDTFGTVQKLNFATWIGVDD